ncbi:hypothetical protein PB01_15680 [Psychrobacillus glaciei]|uniref:Uncharacterized protein n=1 Tax=Psychrobacillus glaciei TaxID=2283160 RepID=A0A5J6SQD1_9BACI|nr:hypothetical protein [Psychrobacillus glaciei]QFG00152.1 hypothetical protein PB01_15680 [Psychrobacillus glaciei]
MTILLYFIVSMVISLIVKVVLLVTYKDKEKLDKGFVFPYIRLSYRRKTIRTLWTFPIILVGLIVIYLYGELNIMWNLILLMVTLILTFLQLANNYKKWKKYERG